MSIAALLALTLTTQTPPKITLELFQGAFIAREGSKKTIVPLKLEQPKPPLAVAFRKNKNFAVWDDRGLSIRTGKKLVSYRLWEVAVSPHLFSRDEILANLALMHQGKRTKNATALSGAKRIGADAYFLARWDDSDGKTWLEALIRVPLDDKAPGWKMLGRFEGLSLARQPIDDKLMVDNGLLAVIARRDSDWGESFYTPAVKAFGFKKFGSNLVACSERKDFSVAFVERTPYGTSVGGSIDLRTGARKESLETRGSLKLVEGDSPTLAVISEDQTETLRNADAGSQIDLPPSAGLRRTPLGVVVWSPLANPVRADLYEPERWKVLASWRQAAFGASAPAGR